jgi:CheY-like chemotaxis protein
MSIRILIADDDSAIRLLLRRLLESHGYRDVCEAESGIDAVEKVSQFAPNIVILDLSMPNMNGFTAARRISNFNPGLPMLLVSVQQVSHQLAQAALDAGFRGAVTKFNGNEVVGGVEALLQNRTFFMIEGSLASFEPSPDNAQPPAETRAD